jgi:hypothetical protein
LLLIVVDQLNTISLLLWLITSHNYVEKMFTDSEIAKGFSCGRTKTTQIVKRAIAPSLNEDVTRA